MGLRVECTGTPFARSKCDRAVTQDYTPPAQHGACLVRLLAKPRDGHDRRLWVRRPRCVWLSGRRHRHPRAPRRPPAPTPEPTGADYLGLMLAAHEWLPS